MAHLKTQEEELADAKRLLKLLQAKKAREKQMGDNSDIIEAQSRVVFLDLSKRVNEKAYFLTDEHRQALIEQLRAFDREDLI